MNISIQPLMLASIGGCIYLPTNKNAVETHFEVCYINHMRGRQPCGERETEYE